MLQMAMSAVVALAGLFLVITAGDSDFRVFGCLLLVVGVLGMVSRFLLRPRRR